MAYIKTEDGQGRQISVPVFNESEDGSGTWHAPVCDSSGYLKVAMQSVLDDVLWKLGTDDDIVLLNRSATTSADEEVTNVIEGTSVHPATAANSLIISNITDDGDILILASDGGNSRAGIWIDGSLPGTYIYNGYLGGTLDANTQAITTVNGLTLVSEKAVYCAASEWCGIAAGTINSADDVYIEMFGISFASSQGSIRIKAGNHAAGDINFYTGANTLRLGITYAGVAAWASGVTHTNLNLGDYLGVFKTDTDSAVEAELWYDDSENKLKFYNGTGVETITSA